jgi:hypothetical protein
MTNRETSSGSSCQRLAKPGTTTTMLSDLGIPRARRQLDPSSAVILTPSGWA